MYALGVYEMGSYILERLGDRQMHYLQKVPVYYTGGSELRVGLWKNDIRINFSRSDQQMEMTKRYKVGSEISK